MNGQQHDVDAEQALIGAVLVNPKMAGRIIERCRAEWFYRPLHQQIWRIAEELHAAGDMALRITIVKGLEAQGMDALEAKLYLIQCYETRATEPVARQYIDIIHDCYTLRFVRDQCNRLADLTEGDEADPVTMVGLLGQAHEAAQRAIGGNMEAVSLADQLNTWVTDMYDRIERGGRQQGWLTGIRRLDDMTGGVLPGKLWIIQAETSGGKSSLAIQMAHAFAKSGARVSIDSHEMGEQDIISRIIAQETGIDLTRLTFEAPTGEEAKQITAAAADLAKLKDRLSIQKQTSDSIDDVLRAAVSTDGLNVLILDYIQLLTAGIRDRRVDVDTIARKLQTYCVTTGCSIVALAQINDDGSTRESRAITHAADVVLNLQHVKTAHRDPNGFEVFKDDAMPTCLVMGRITKQRNGPRGPVPLVFHKARTMFYQCESV